MILGTEPKRLGVFFFFDAQGHVDSYVDRLLADIVENLDELVVVVNGTLTQEGRRELERHAGQVIVRENTGMDVWAYKTALDSYGWDALSDFDEIVLFNFTIMGPVYPFSEMFTEMAGRDVDFWGITAFHEVRHESEEDSANDIPWHIQSHFHAYRRTLVQDPQFRQYWDDLRPITDYSSSVTHHEQVFTAKFKELGFVPDVYVDTTDLEGITTHPIIFAPKRLIAEKRCPIFKRRSFFHDYRDMLDQSVGTAARELYEYLRDHTSYDTNLIWDNALRTMNLVAIVQNLQLTYVLPTATVEIEPTPSKVAMVMHVHYMELLPQMLTYARAMPTWADIIITVGSQEKVDHVKAATADMAHTVIVREVVNRGRDVSALLVGAADLVMQYDIVCFIHDKKVTQILPGTVGEGFAAKCFDNVAPTAPFVSNVLALFAKEPRLGVLTPTVPNHADYFPISAYAWGPNMDRTKALLRELGIRVAIQEEIGLVAPLGSTFWFRPEALRVLFDKGWTYEDFPLEPLGGDGTISHAIERSHSYVAQSAGYFSAWLFSDSFARTELTNLAYYTRELTRALADHTDLTTLRIMLRDSPLSSSAWYSLRQGIKRKLPKTLIPAARVAYRALRSVRRVTRGKDKG